MISKLIRHFLTLLCCLYAGGFLLAQGQRIDSLEQRLTTAINPSEQSEILVQLFDDFQNTNPDKALLVALQNRKLTHAGENFSDQHKMDADNRVGIAFMNLNQSTLFLCPRPITTWVC
jgi:hypothetical protein